MSAVAQFSAFRIPPLFTLFKRLDMQSTAFVLALGVYAFFGSPTPDKPSVAELVIGALLLISAGVGGVYDALRPGVNAQSYRKIGAVLLVFGSVMPFFTGVFQENGIKMMMRDYIPFVFMLFPLFFSKKLQKNSNFFKIILFSYIFLGVLFAFRVVSPLIGLDFVHFLKSEALYYLANVPSVLFSALILTGWGGYYLTGIKTGRRFLFGLLLVCFAVLPVTAMAANLQRATLGAFAVYIAVLGVLGFIRAPYKMPLSLLMTGAAGYFLWPLIAGMAGVLAEKNALVGLNMRWQEARAVWEVVGAGPLSLVFGMGWGAHFHSPAVGGVSVNFTHSLLTAMLLKTGLSGLLLTLFYLAALGRMLLDVILKAPVLGLAIAAPVLINVFLYASYKSLDFGIILLLIPAALYALKSLAAEARQDTATGHD